MDNMTKDNFIYQFFIIFKVSGIAKNRVQSYNSCPLYVQKHHAEVAVGFPTF